MRVAITAAAMLSMAIAVAAVARAQQPKPLSEADRAANAREVVQVYADKLRSELAAALKIGIVQSIGACNTLAPELNDQTSSTSSFEVTRTALKLRNPENAPDEWEARTLELFQRKLAAGADIAKLEHFEQIANAEGDKLFRYMKAIPTLEMCLGCHGSDVKQEIKAEIARYYLEDKAIGHKLGDLRGAFSLVQLVE